MNRDVPKRLSFFDRSLTKLCQQHTGVALGLKGEEDMVSVARGLLRVCAEHQEEWTVKGALLTVTQGRDLAFCSGASPPPLPSPIPVSLYPASCLVSLQRIADIKSHCAFTGYHADCSGAR